MSRLVARWNRHDCYKVTAYEGRAKVGEIDGCLVKYHPRFDRLYVRFVEVAEPHRRRGIGTKLYEQAARLACEKGVSLVSSEAFERSRMSTGFWEKQRRKGRATVDERGEYRLLNPCKADLSGAILPDRLTRAYIQASRDLTRARELAARRNCKEALRLERSGRRRFDAAANLERERPQSVASQRRFYAWNEVIQTENSPAIRACKKP
jgi:predicted GNAT family acetyltransferase